MKCNSEAYPLSRSKRVIHIHAGLPKTGSSAIQRFLNANREGLADRGLLVPEFGLGERGDHHEWMYLVGGIKGYDRRRAVQGLVRYLLEQRHENILISTEFAYLLMRFGFAGKGYRALRRAGFDLRFHMFVRPQTDFAVSAHPEFLRNLLVDQPFPAFVQKNFLPFALDYGRIAKDLGKVSRGPVSVLPYHRAARQEGVWWPLLDSVGLPIAQADRHAFALPGEVNPSLGPVGVMALTQALRRIDRRAIMKRWGLRRAVRRAVLRVTGGFPAEAERYNPLRPEDRRLLWEQCRTLNDPFAQATWGQDWDDVFAEEFAHRPRVQIYGRLRDDPESENARLHDRLSRRLFRKIRQKTEEIAEKRRQTPSLTRLLGAPVDRLADQAMRRIVRGW